MQGLRDKQAAEGIPHAEGSQVLGGRTYFNYAGFKPGLMEKTVRRVRYFGAVDR